MANQTIDNLIAKVHDGLSLYVREPIVTFPDMLNCLANRSLKNIDHPQSMKVFPTRSIADTTWLSTTHRNRHRFYGFWRDFLVITLVHPRDIEDIITMRLQVPWIQWRTRSHRIGNRSLYFTVPRSQWLGLCGYELVKCHLPSVFATLWLDPDRPIGTHSKLWAINPSYMKKTKGSGRSVRPGHYNFLACFIPTADALHECDKRTPEGSKEGDHA